MLELMQETRDLRSEVAERDQTVFAARRDH